MNENLRLFLALTPLLLAVSAAIVWLHYSGKKDEKARKDWKIFCEGSYARVEYGEYDYATTRHVGMAGHTTDRHIMKVTAVHFEDGRAVVLKGRHNMLFPKGTLIRIMVNGLEERKIEKAE